MQTVQGVKYEGFVASVGVCVERISLDDLYVYECHPFTNFPRASLGTAPVLSNQKKSATTKSK
jgi:hypothetical protein